MSRTRPIIVSALLLLAFLAGASLVHSGEDAGAILSMLSGEKRGKVQPVEDEKGAMNAFYAALSRTAAKKPGAVTRISHYGDSLIEMDLLSGDARRRLQKNFGDAGHGFLSVAKTRNWYSHEDVLYKPDPRWVAFQLGDKGSPSNRFGLGGAVSVAYKPGANLVVGTVKGNFGKTVSSFQVLTLQSADGGLVDVELDGKKLGSFSTKAAGPADGAVSVKVPEGSHKLVLTARDQGTKLLGAILESGGPGVVYDALGVNGIGAFSLLRSDREHWKAQLAHRNPDLVVLGFGTNDATEKNLNIPEFKTGLRQVVALVKAALPNSSILLMSPLDRGEKQGTGVVTMATIPKITAAEREVARETGVAFWDSFAAMGGEGSAAKWLTQSPRLWGGDLMHPTRDGSKVLGDLWYDALMNGFALYLKSNGVALQPRPAAASTLQEIRIQ